MAQHLVVVVGLVCRYDELGDGGGMVFTIPAGPTIPSRPGLSFQTKTDPLSSLSLFSILPFLAYPDFVDDHCEQ